MTATLDPITANADPIWPLLAELASCLCAELESSGLPSTCFCGVFPGAAAPFDYCGPGCSGGGCGQAWTRLSQASPSSSFPASDIFRIGNCASPLAFEAEIGIARCAPMPDERGNLPSLSNQLDASRLQVADMQAMRRAVQCCAKASRKDMMLGSYIPFGPEGGCVGGIWTVAISEL